MRRIIVITSLMLLSFVLTACNNLSKDNINEVDIIQDNDTIHTFTKEEHAKEISILVKAVNKVKKQRAEIDMPPSDYSLEFNSKDGSTQSYLLWLDSDSAFLLDNSTSDFAQLSSSYVEKLNQIIIEHYANGITTFNFYYLTAGFPVLILLLMLVDILGSRKKDRDIS